MSLTSESKVIIRGIPALSATLACDVAQARGLANNANAACDGAARVVCAQAVSGSSVFNGQFTTTDTTPVGPIACVPYLARIRHDGRAYPVRVRVAASTTAGVLTVRAVIGDYDSMFEARRLSAPVPGRSLDITYSSPTASYGAQVASMVRLTAAQTARCMRRVPTRQGPTGVFGEVDVAEVWLALFAWTSTSTIATVQAVYAAEFVGDA